MDYAKESLRKHYEWAGKLEITARAPAGSREELSLAYTPGVAEPCLAIKEDVNKSYELTRRHNMVLVATDGSAVLGLGDIGPEAGMPVMEGKCVLFKAFAGVDAFPLCIKSQDVDEIVRTIALISGSFGGVNLEDIAAPRCFEIEEKLKKCTDIPIFHDDQHGTAIVCLAAAINAMKAVGKKAEDCTVVCCGCGAAGVAIIKLFRTLGFKDIIAVDRGGILCQGDPALPPHHAELASFTNREGKTGTLADALKGADIFFGTSAPGIVTKEMVASMAPGAIVFGMANPVPEIMPELAREAGAAVVGSGRSDYPNQINNVLAFPGVFRGALDVRASDINEEMKLAAAKAIAGLVSEEELSPEFVMPYAFDPRLGATVAAAVAQAARDSGVARI